MRWSDLDGIGTYREAKLRGAVADTPEQYAAICTELTTDGGPQFVELDIRLLTEADNIGHGIALNIVDQLVDLLREDDR